MNEVQSVLLIIASILAGGLLIALATARRSFAMGLRKAKAGELTHLLRDRVVEWEISEEGLRWLHYVADGESYTYVSDELYAEMQRAH